MEGPRAQGRDRELRKAKLSVAFTRLHLQRILEKVDHVIFEQEKNEVIVLDGSEVAFKDAQRMAGDLPFTGGSSSSISVSPLSEIRGHDGLIGFAGGTEEQRLAAIDSLAAGEPEAQG